MRPRMLTLPGVAPPAPGLEVLAMLDQQPAPHADEHLAELEAAEDRRQLRTKWLARALDRVLAGEIDRVLGFVP